jgi:sugar lactone lactonase YvrE
VPLQEPWGIAADSQGNLFIADTGNRLIRRVDAATGMVATVAGTGVRGSSGDGGPATAARVHAVTAITVDAKGNIFVADGDYSTFESMNPRIRKVDAVTGIITTVAGGGRAFPGDGGLATNARLLPFPRGLAVDARGNLFIADGSRVRRVDAATGIITTVAGTGTEGFAGDGGPATRAKMNRPFGLVADARGDLFVADLGNARIRKVDAATGIITTVAGTGTEGFAGDGGPAIRAQLTPTSLALHPNGHLLIADSGNHRIRKMDIATGMITTIAGSGIAGFAGDGGPANQAQLGWSLHVACDRRGNLFILTGDRVRRVDGQTGIITTVAGENIAAMWGDRGPATNATLSGPRHVAVDLKGNLFIADFGHFRVRKVDSRTGIITTVAGTGIGGFSGDGGSATAARLGYVSCIVVDAVGHVYIADTSNNRIRRVDARTGIITTVMGTGVGGYAREGDLASRSMLSEPASIALDTFGNLFIADAHYYRVLRVDAATGIIARVAGTGKRGFSGDSGQASSAELSNLKSIAIDPSGNLFLGDGPRIRRIDAATGIVTTVAGTGNEGSSGDGGPATAARIHTPESLAVDPKGGIFLADSARVRKVDVATGIITTIAGTGKEGFSGDGGPAALAELRLMTSVAIEAVGHLLIADTSNNRIRRVDAGTGIITTIAGAGREGFSGDGGPATDAKLNWPADIALDTRGHLYIADMNNHRVRRVDAVTGIITTVAGTGILGSSGDRGPAKSAQLNRPCGTAVSATGDLFIAEGGSHRIRKVDARTGIITTVVGGGTTTPVDGTPAIDVKLRWPCSIALDATGNLFFTDSEGRKIRKVDARTGIITTVAGSGLEGTYGDGKPAKLAPLWSPRRIVLDSHENLFIVNWDRVRKVDARTGIITTVAGGGEATLGDGGPAAGAELAWPTGVAIDTKGDLLVADSNAQRIRRVDGATGIITTVATLGEYGHLDDGRSTGSGIPDEEHALALDTNGNLYITDQKHHSIRRMNMTTGNVTTVVASHDDDKELRFWSGFPTRP